MKKAIAILLIAAFMVMGLGACETARRAGKSFEDSVSGSGDRVIKDLKKTRDKLER